MKRLFALFFIIGWVLGAKGQAGEMTFDWLKHWPHIQSSRISADGKLVVYEIQSESDPPKLVIRSVGEGLEQRIEGGTLPAITSDSKFVIFRIGSDSLGIFSVLERSWREMSGISSYKVSPFGSEPWIGCKLLKTDTVLLLDLEHRTCKRFSAEGDFQFSPDGATVLLHAKSTMAGALETLTIVDLSSGSQNLIYKGGGRLSHIVFSEAGRQLTFISSMGLALAENNALLYYQKGADSAVKLVSSTTAGMPPRMTVGVHKSGYPLFSKDGKYIFFTIDSATFAASAPPDGTAGLVTVWDTNEDFLPTQRVNENTAPLPILAVTSTVNISPIVVVTQTGDRQISFSPSDFSDQVIVGSYKGNPLEDYWRLSTRESYAMVSLRDGTRKSLVAGLLYDNCRPSFSPGGKFIVWFDRSRQTYFSYSNISGRIVDFSSRIPYRLGAIANGEAKLPGSTGIAAWGVGDSSLLLNDGFDIWEVDPEGKWSPKNTTAFYGRQKKISFQYLEPLTGQGRGSVVQSGQKLLLRGHDSLSKDDGYYSLVLGKPKVPVKLMIGPVLEWGSPRRAKSADAYLLTMEGPQMYPNLYFTRDFRKFQPLSDLHPQRSVNWYTVGLIRWKMPDSSGAVGVLYKPADFDSNKRYPVIFSLYEGMSDEVNMFQTAETSAGAINIPWFVNHGYLVCFPDIKYQTGIPGESALRTVLSCAQYLAHFRWVDSTKMGLHGHSFGGYEVNYIVTKTHFFAAACSAAGISELASLTYNLRSGVGESAEFVSEQSQMRMRGPLWNNREEYVKGSPLYFADQVTTPLLIVHGDQDEKVPWSQAIGWFLALRRLGRSVWMLQYRGEGHALSKEYNKIDYTTRLQQFYDYYLKERPAPAWISCEK